MKTVNSLSGGKTSSYIAANYPADYNVFSLVRTDDKNCMFPDKKIRQEVSDRLGVEFIGTLEEDTIIYTMLDLEQFIGSKIDWVTGKAFDDVILRNGKKYLPNVTQRFCTTEMKLQPLFDWWRSGINEVVEMRIGFRANEQSRAKTMLSKTNENGYSTFKAIIGKRKTQNKWSDIEWQKPSFPLIKDNIYKDKVEKYWKDKNVRFAYMNNCIGCFHRSPVLLKHMSDKHPSKYQWFVNAEQNTGYNTKTFKNGLSYDKIRKSLKQTSLFDDDFNECDSGYCGL
ncbi:MAG: hypothetical protein GY766_05455 [Herbaspirillum sp.]|uniref:hypothetical protein n=1 Tax=Herbaspirillum sp. TaxID=1890675 RepID=UPI002583EEA1|nr:hypothetical protein [Herbaspirillum sp.]MCP3654329.1 hypothetical protein [Herbaspirillum sp.]